MHSEIGIDPDDLHYIASTSSGGSSKNAYASRNTSQSELYLTLPIYWGCIQFKMVESSTEKLYIRLKWMYLDGYNWTSWKQIY